MSGGPRIEIFRRLRSGSVEWVETVENVELAREHAKTLVQEHPATYFIFDRENACFIDPLEIVRPNATIADVVSTADTIPITSSERK